MVPSVFVGVLLFLDLPSFTPSRLGIMVLTKTVLVIYSTVLVGICRLSARGCVPTFPLAMTTRPSRSQCRRDGVLMCLSALSSALTFFEFWRRRVPAGRRHAQSIFCHDSVIIVL